MSALSADGFVCRRLIETHSLHSQKYTILLRVLKENEHIILFKQIRREKLSI